MSKERILERVSKRNKCTSADCDLPSIEIHSKCLVHAIKDGVEVPCFDYMFGPLYDLEDCAIREINLLKFIDSFKEESRKLQKFISVFDITIPRLETEIIRSTKVYKSLKGREKKPNVGKM